MVPLQAAIHDLMEIYMDQEAEIERLQVSEGKWRDAWSALHKMYADDTERLRAALKQIADEEYVNAPEATFIARKALNEQPAVTASWPTAKDFDEWRGNQPVDLSSGRKHDTEQSAPGAYTPDGSQIKPRGPWPDD